MATACQADTGGGKWRLTIVADGLKRDAPDFVAAGTNTFYYASQTDSLFLGKNRPDSVTSQTAISLVHSLPGETLKFTRDTDSESWSFGSWTGAAWSNDDDQI